MLNLVKDADEQAARYRTYASYARGAAWGLVVFTVAAIAITSYGYYRYDLELRADLVVVTVIFFSAPSLLGFWVYELCRGHASRYHNRSLRITNQILQERIVSMAACRQCRSAIVQMRADRLMAAWDAQQGKANDGG